MGKGDKKTKRGKIVRGSHGVRRKKKKKSTGKAPELIKDKPEIKKETSVKDNVDEPAVSEELKKENTEPIADKSSPKKTKKVAETDKDVEITEEKDDKEDKTVEAGITDKAKEE